MEIKAILVLVYLFSALGVTLMFRREEKKNPGGLYKQINEEVGHLLNATIVLQLAIFCNTWIPLYNTYKLIEYICSRIYWRYAKWRLKKIFKKLKTLTPEEREHLNNIADKL